MGQLNYGQGSGRSATLSGPTGWRDPSTYPICSSRHGAAQYYYLVIYGLPLGDPPWLRCQSVAQGLGENTRVSKHGVYIVSLADWELFTVPWEQRTQLGTSTLPCDFSPPATEIIFQLPSTDQQVFHDTHFDGPIRDLPVREVDD